MDPLVVLFFINTGYRAVKIYYDDFAKKMNYEVFLYNLRPPMPLAFSSKLQRLCNLGRELFLIVEHLGLE